MQMAGATTPVTFAGCIAIANAEVLSQLVVIQLLNPGAPVIYGGSPSIMDMRTMIYSYGAPERALMVGGLTELCHYYKLPMWGTGGCSDARGIQGVAEGTYSLLTSALTGADLVHNVFAVELVLANEIIGMVKVLMGGIEINDETLALDLIERLGPGANYLAEPHTLKHFREVWAPSMFTRTSRGEEGGKDCEELVRERTIEIIKTHRPKPLPEDVVKELKKVEAGWLKRIGLTDYPKREQVT
jgi:trimethylamine--corrinoid protein Co-methyltransferase